MVERNLCVDSGCLGYCCENIDLEMANDERERIFPDAVRLDTIKELAEINLYKIPGVYYARYRKSHLKERHYSLVSIEGSCPNRNPDGSCSKHNQRESAARNFKIGSKDCNAIRAEHGLPPISLEPVE